MGAGWKKLDYDRSGIPMEAPKVRVDRMIEHTKILKALFTDDRTGVVRRASTTASPICPGRPARTRPAVRRSSSAVASGACCGSRAPSPTSSGVNASIHSGEVDTDAAHDAMPVRIDEKVGWLREGAGARFDQLEINAWLAAAEVTDDTPAVADVMGQLFSADPLDVLASPLTLVGSIAECADRLHERRERWGYSYTTIPGEKARDFAPLVAHLTGQ